MTNNLLLPNERPELNEDASSFIEASALNFAFWNESETGIILVTLIHFLTTCIF